MGKTFNDEDRGAISFNFSDQASAVASLKQTPAATPEQSKTEQNEQTRQVKSTKKSGIYREIKQSEDDDPPRQGKYI